MSAQESMFTIKKEKNLSPRIQKLREYYFQGANRSWNNEYTSWTTGTPWDTQYNEMNYYIAPENYTFFNPFRASFIQTAHPVALSQNFWSWQLPERRAWFNKEVMVHYLPKEILPGDLLAGGRFNIQTSLCLTKEESDHRDALLKAARNQLKWFHNHGYGNAGATSGHLVPGHERILSLGWKGIYEDLDKKYNHLNFEEKNGPKGAQLRAMKIASTMASALAEQYAIQCRELANSETDMERRKELTQMAKNLDHVPWDPPNNFWEAVQALWINHMLVMSDENYPGPGVSFGRIDQYLYPYWKTSLTNGMTREFGKEILKCFVIHANTAYDAFIRTGNQGITSGFGQLITLGGLGPDHQDLTNDLTLALLEVIDDMSPILEPKPNIRIHKNTPDVLLDKAIDMIASSQGAPFLLNFDERAMAGLLFEASKSNCKELIHPKNVHDYAPVGCLENTMVGNDRSGTVDNNLNLLKAVELTLTGGKDLIPYGDIVLKKFDPITQDGPQTGDATQFSTWDQFYDAFKLQLQFIIRQCVDLYDLTEKIRAQFSATPYLSCMVKGCAEKGKDITQGGAEIGFTTINAVTFATTVDSLLAIKYLIFDKKYCTMKELIQALKDNWEGHPVLQARARNKAPKYGQDNHEADQMAFDIMSLWCNEVWKYKTQSTHRQFRPGMLSWNYWVSDGYILAASPDGRPKGRFLSNAICPSNGADINGPTANTNSIGKALGGKKQSGEWEDYLNIVPGGASHTITFNPSILKDAEHKNKFKAFLKGYAENGGTALQINMLDPDMLRDAQKHPQDYRHLLVRITGYNAYFTSIGKELQDEVIERVSHNRF